MNECISHAKSDRALSDHVRKSQELYRTCFQLGLIGMAITSPTKGCLEVNDEICRMLGYDRGELLRKTWAELTHPDDLAADVANFNRVMAGDCDGYAMDKRWIRKDGGVIHTTISVQCVRREDAAIDHFVALVKDVTQHRQAEHALRQSEGRLAAELAAMKRLQEVSTRLVNEGDKTSLLQEIVDAAITITGADMGNVQLLDADEGGLNVVASRGFDPDVIAAFGTVHAGEFTCGTAMQRRERVIVEDVATSPIFVGTPRLQTMLAVGIRAAQSTPLVARSGQLMGMLTTHYRRPCAPAERDLRVVDLLARQAADWIERTRDDEALREAKETAERANHVKDEFLATLSHELRTPLSAILLWGKMLAQGVVSDWDHPKAFRAIISSAEAQNQLIGDLLDMSRMVSGKLRIDVRRIELVPVVLAAIDAVRPAADAKKVLLEPPAIVFGAELSMMGDPNRVQQIVWNLLSNAVKFTPSEGRVDVQLERLEDTARLTIRDNGEGISPDFLPHVFERFQQADGRAIRAQTGLGLGLGLAIVHELVQLHGGSIRADSAGEGQGATFTVNLPLAEGVQSPDGSPLENEPAPAGMKPLQGLRVLVVEDEPATREALMWVLETAGALITGVETAADALETLRRDVINVMVSDIGLPGEDGYALIQRARRATAQRGGRPTPALALTAYAHPEDRERALAAGFNSYLPKPVGPAELIRAVAGLGGRMA